MREVIEEHLDELEDLYLAEQDMAEVRAGRLKTVPLEAVMKEDGLETFSTRQQLNQIPAG